MIRNGADRRVRRACQSNTAAMMLSLGLSAIATAASAQGISPDDLPGEGYRLPGGIEPVLQLRTYYFDQQSLTGVPSTAWALGGWAGLRTPWIGEAVQFGAAGYTSQRLYGPQGEGGTLLLQSDQAPINVLGLAWGALRLAGQTFTAFRQLINRPFINPQDNRMVPNTFEAYTLSGSLASTFAYTGGYIAKIKNRDSEEFVSMSKDAGGSGANEGLYFVGADWDYMKDGRIRADYQYGKDVFSTFYVDGRLPVRLGEQTKLGLSAQYSSQRSVGSAQIGNFSTWNGGARGVLTHGAFNVQLMYTRTGTGFDSQSPYGESPTDLNEQQVAFNTAGERAWGLGAGIDFASLGAPGLSASAVYASGSHRIDDASGAPLPDRNETDLRADYRFAKGSALQGLWLTLRYSWLRQDGSPQTQTQARVIVNYPVSF